MKTLVFREIFWVAFVPPESWFNWLSICQYIGHISGPSYDVQDLPVNTDRFPQNSKWNIGNGHAVWKPLVFFDRCLMLRTVSVLCIFQHGNGIILGPRTSSSNSFEPKENAAQLCIVLGSFALNHPICPSGRLLTIREIPGSDYTVTNHDIDMLRIAVSRVDIALPYHYTG